MGKRKIGTKRKNSVHYVDNAELVKEIVEYKNQCSKIEKGQRRPKMSEELGVMLLKIAQRLATSPKFKGYTFVDDMVGDAVENCIMYISNFDVEKSTNAFAYVTQISYFAFLRRIQKEDKQQYVKILATEKSGVLGMFQDFNRSKYEKKKPKKSNSK